MGEKKPRAATAKALPASPARNTGGRPEIPFTEKEYRQVEAMLGYGLFPKEAAVVIGVSEATLKRRLREIEAEQGFDPLELARAKVLGNLAQSAYHQAIGYKRTELDAQGKPVEVDVPPNARMTQFLMNVLGGSRYVPKKSLELKNPDDGKPFEMVITDYRSKKAPA